MRTSPRKLTALGALGALALAGCSSGSSTGSAASGSTDTTSATATQGAADSPSSSASAGGSGQSSASGASGSSTGSGTSTGGAQPVSACVRSTYDRMSAAQRLGQLLMVGVQGGSTTAADSLITGSHVGNVLFLGGWSGRSTVASASSRLQDQVSSTSTANVPLLVAADQEGGSVQQLKGSGFPTLVSAVQQGSMSPSRLRSYAAGIGSSLKSAGVNVNLAPVADTVPTSVGTRNAPIGRFAREYGHDPATVAAAVTQVVGGLRSSGVGSTVKHFPGIGRITGNTDFTSSGITDTQATTSDPYLQPFRAGIKADADLVMVSSARYPKLDATNAAPFSAPIIDGLLRDKLGWKGVVITDDMNAVAVRGVPVGQRATQFVAAGGDIILTGSPATVAPMLAALRSRAGSDPAFAAKLKTAQQRVLTLKADLGLLKC